MSRADKHPCSQLLCKCCCCLAASCAQQCVTCTMLIDSQTALTPDWYAVVIELEFALFSSVHAVVAQALSRVNLTPGALQTHRCRHFCQQHAQALLSDTASGNGRTHCDLRSPAVRHWLLWQQGAHSAIIHWLLRNRRTSCHQPRHGVLCCAADCCAADCLRMAHAARPCMQGHCLKHLVMHCRPDAANCCFTLHAAQLCCV